MGTLTSLTRLKEGIFLFKGRLVEFTPQATAGRNINTR